MAIFSHHHHFFSLSFSLGFRREQDFFFIFSRSSSSFVGAETFSSTSEGCFTTTEKEKNQKIHNTRARAKRRKRRSDQTRGNVFYSFSLSLSISLYVCVYFIITKRELKMVSNYIFYAYVATTPASFSTAGIRNPSVRDRSALSSLRGAKSRKRRRCTQKLTSLSTRRLL